MRAYWCRREGAEYESLGIASWLGHPQRYFGMACPYAQDVHSTTMVLDCEELYSQFPLENKHGLPELDGDRVRCRLTVRGLHRSISRKCADEAGRSQRGSYSRSDAMEMNFSRPNG